MRRTFLRRHPAITLAATLITAGVAIPTNADARVATLSRVQAQSAPLPIAILATWKVDVSDWPVGILPDDVASALGPASIAALRAAVADWPSGALPDDASMLTGG